MSSKSLTKPHLYQLALFIILFVLVLVITVWMYTEMLAEKGVPGRELTPQETKAEVEKNFGTPVEISPQEKADVEKNFGGKIKK